MSGYEAALNGDLLEIGRGVLLLLVLVVWPLAIWLFGEADE
jgi:hypothetical protein